MNAPPRPVSAASLPRFARFAAFATGAMRALAAVPVLLALVYSTCGQRTGFSLAVEVAGLHFAVSTCH